MPIEIATMDDLRALEARVSALESAPVEPPIAPPTEPPTDPVDPPTIPVPPVVGPIDDRFAALMESPNLHMAVPFNNPEDTCTYWRPCANDGHPNEKFTYDPAENAVRLDMRSYGITSRDQLRVYFDQLDKHNCEMVSLQWQVKIDGSYDETSGLQTFKAFQLSNRGEGLMWEYQWRFSRAKPGAAALPTNRLYRDVSYSESIRNDPVAVNGPGISPVNNEPMMNWQPGGDTSADYRQLPFGREDHMNPAVGSPFVLPLDQWITYTTDFMFVDGQLRARVWLSDEETPPTLVLEGKDGNGFVISDDINESSMGFQNWWIEMNSSQEGSTDHVRSLWVKNFIVYKNASVPR